MTTTDPFTTAARAHAEALTGPPVAGETSWDYRYLFEAGAEWARSYLVTQAPSDAEVEAVTDALRDWILPGVPTDPVARAALSAARNARGGTT